MRVRSPALALACLLGTVAGQEPSRHTNKSNNFSLLLPEGWRQLTPDEAVKIGKGETPLPPDMLSARPAAFYPYGAVDQWLAGEFDGRRLTFAFTTGETSVDEDGMARLREHAAEASRDSGWQQEILEGRIVEIGPGDHPVIECITRLARGDGTPTVKSLDLFAPTGGDTLILSFRAWEDDFEAALPFFRGIAETLRFLRPARGKSEIGDRLLYPIVVGALVGLLLLVLRRKAMTRV